MGFTIFLAQNYLYSLRRITFKKKRLWKGCFSLKIEVRITGVRKGHQCLKVLLPGWQSAGSLSWAGRHSCPPWQCTHSWIWQLWPWCSQRHQAWSRWLRVPRKPGEGNPIKCRDYAKKQRGTRCQPFLCSAEPLPGSQRRSWLWSAGCPWPPPRSPWRSTRGAGPGEPWSEGPRTSGRSHTPQPLLKVCWEVLKQELWRKIALFIQIIPFLPHTNAYRHRTLHTGLAVFPCSCCTEYRIFSLFLLFVKGN